MARIGNRNTSPELVLRKLLWRQGLRYQLHRRVEGARPDIVFGRARVAVFIDGCFWHGCPEHYVRPRSREEFWAEKLRTNIERDRAQTLHLEAQGWTILRFWEHDVARRAEQVVAEVLAAVHSEERPRRRRSSWVVVEVTLLSADGRYERRHLQDLRKPARSRVEERERSTRKW
jgi:DNA mismatch endonuclease (patch repair protein)